MKRFLLPLLLCLTIVLAPAQAQDYEYDDRTAAMERMERVMAMHEQFMSDSLYRAHMMADTSMQAAMREMMSPETAAMHEKMAMMDHAERMEMMAEVHGRMMERAHGMSAEELAAFHARMMEAHDRAMADPAMRERMMANPEMMEMHHEMMEGHHGEMMEGHDEMHDERMHDERMHDGMHERMEDDTDG
jgi:hypothetical protein